MGANIVKCVTQIIFWSIYGGSILAWKLPWMEEPGGLQSVGSQRVGHTTEGLTLSHGGR